MIFQKFTKDSSAFLNHKSDFISENMRLLEDNAYIANAYKAQPLRTECKNCGLAAKENVAYDFSSHGIDYYFCKTCNHLNGAHQETKQFLDELYNDNKELQYHKDYTNEDVQSYLKRAKEIYVPKADFLEETLHHFDDELSDHNVLDVGAGAGYFVNVLRERGIVAKGVEVSKSTVSFGNYVMKYPALRSIGPDEINDIIENTEASVVSLIGVLEHLESPRETLSAIRRNSNIKYLYFSIPLFSMAIYLEIFFQNVFNRVLGGAHTHLYTPESIEYFIQEFGFTTCSEWWFGADMADLMRFGSVTLEEKKCSPYIKQIWHQMMTTNCNSFQTIIDQEKFCNEVHMLVRNS